MDLVNVLWDLISEVWSFIKHIYRKVVSFFTDIYGYFKEKSRLKKLQEDKENLAISIKQKLDSGDYNVVNCIFNKKTGQLTDYENAAEHISAEALDSDAQSKFGNKDMLLLR